MAEEYYREEGNPWYDDYSCEVPEIREEPEDTTPFNWKMYQQQMNKYNFSEGQVRSEFNSIYLINTPWWKEPNSIINSSEEIISSN